jgi:hypothetical protein
VARGRVLFLTRQFAEGSGAGISRVSTRAIGSDSLEGRSEVRPRATRCFYLWDYDQHIFHVPSVVQFGNGQTVVVPQLGTNVKACGLQDLRSRNWGTGL